MFWRKIQIGFLGWVALTSFVSADTLENIRVSHTAGKTQVVLDLSDTPNYKYFTLTQSDRLVVDLKNIKTVKPRLPQSITDSRILNKIRKSTPQSENTYRLVFELKDKTKAVVTKIAPKQGYGHRLVIELPYPHQAVIAPPPVKKELPVQKPAVVQTQHRPNLAVGGGDIVIAVDAGHGGKDPGAIGPRGKYEKHVNLAIAKLLAERLNKVAGIKAALTRTGDYFIDLNKRTEIARKAGAHFLVSIHADGFDSPQPSGASVWILSANRATSEVGRLLENQEAQDGLLGIGESLSSTKDTYLKHSLIKMQLKNSQDEGVNVATLVLKELGRVTELHKDKPQGASLAVLKASDIPSILVEAGFISNHHEEKKLYEPSHQRKIADAVYKGLVTHVEQFPPPNTLIAARKAGVHHRVVAGQSLSAIAIKYGTTVAALKTANNLSSNHVRAGQVLTIPHAQFKNTASSTTANSVTRIHTVRMGEYLGKIAQNYGVSVASIRQANALRSDELAAGQKLKILGATPSAQKHKVKTGEYLGKIAANYGVSVDSLRRANQLNDDELAVGQTLIIPGS